MQSYAFFLNAANLEKSKCDIIGDECENPSDSGVVNYREYSGGEELKEAETDNGEIHNDGQDDLRIVD